MSNVPQYSKQMETTYQLPYPADSSTPPKRLRGVRRTILRFQGVIGMALPPDIPSDSVPHKEDIDDTNLLLSIHLEDVTGSGPLLDQHPDSYGQLSDSRIACVSRSNDPQLVVDSEELKQPEPFPQSSSSRGDNTMSSLIGEQYHN
ncbi:hypothetical protein M413DRAFT_32481 [Hebeloma cylindrosporum]|uniref:Uncharacterized protein n=1 Tax=Hebeloma cylindrosporum TaxID=76867 RepID=A0A0C3BVL5_HEBCY|nr:hypothetical protein M413DRAFT_32481 [Hebeloma cylindrosporum h7]